MKTVGAVVRAFRFEAFEGEVVDKQSDELHVVVDEQDASGLFVHGENVKMRVEFERDRGLRKILTKRSELFVTFARRNFNEG